MTAQSRARIGGLLGFTATAALGGLLYFLMQFDLASFIPLDIAQAIIRVTPGLIATQGIEALGSGAKQAIEASGFVLFLLAGTFTGAAVAWFKQYYPVSNGLLAGVGALVATVAVQALGNNFPDLITLGVTALLCLGWGLGLFWLLNAAEKEPRTENRESPERRAFLQRSVGALLTVAVGTAAVAELVRRAGEAQVAREIASGGAPAMPNAPLPTPGAVAATAIPLAQGFAAGRDLRPALTPSGDLYVVAAAIRPPKIDAKTWHLSIGGMVERPATFSYDQLRALPRVEQPSTLTCVSNEVGGNLQGTIVWSGVRLRDLLEQAGVQTGAVDVVFRSVEGYSDSLPFARALDQRVLVAYGMNGETLETKHGFPARIIVPGIYGMKNVKWLTKIEVVNADYQGYWQQRGWSDTAVVKTQSTVDTGNTALNNQQTVALENGSLTIGGYAFAGDRGIRSVDVQIDGGAWVAAQLALEPSPLVRRQWSYTWQPAPGKHTVAVRATDTSGQQQTPDKAPPHPDGSSGWHTLEIDVRG